MHKLNYGFIKEASLSLRESTKLGKLNWVLVLGERPMMPLAYYSKKRLVSLVVQPKTALVWMLLAKAWVWFCWKSSRSSSPKRAKS